jgi:hypothetical protein
LKNPALENESQNIELTKSLLTRAAGGGGGGIDLRCDLIDVEIYVMAHWSAVSSDDFPLTLTLACLLHLFFFF